LLVSREICKKQYKCWKLPGTPFGRMRRFKDLKKLGDKEDEISVAELRVEVRAAAMENGLERGLDGPGIGCTGDSR
jgi:hypothetical protein